MELVSLRSLSTPSAWIFRAKDALILCIFAWAMETDDPSLGGLPSYSQRPPVGPQTKVVIRSLQISPHSEEQIKSMLVE